MNFSWDKTLKAVLLFFGFVLVLGFLEVGLQWFSDNIKYFFNWKMAGLSGALLSAPEPKKEVPARNLAVPNLSVNAGAAVAVESSLAGNDKVLFAQNGQQQLPIASITKLMTALVALENYQISQRITVTKPAVLQEGKRGCLALGDAMSVKDLLFIMLVESSNHAAYALADAMGEEKFVQLMNARAKSLGLDNTYFADPTGLSAQNRSTANDLVKLTEYLVKNYPIVVQISKTKEVDLYCLNGTYYGKLENTNQMLGEIPEIIGGKTGFTTDAKGCLMLVLDNPKNNDYLIYVVLGAEDRFGEMKKIINWVNEAYSW